MSSRQGGTQKPLKAAKKADKAELDDEDKAFQAKKKAEEKAAKDFVAKNKK